MFRLALWAAFFGAVWWAYNEYWPTDERDLAADEDVAGSGVLTVADLPNGWSPAALPLVSPLTLTADDEGVLPVEACELFAGDIENSLDEPTRRQSFISPTERQSVAHATIVGADTGLAGSVLDNLREPEAGACLTELWQALPTADGGTLTISSTMAMTDPVFGDEAAWWRLTGSPAIGPAQIADVITVRVDRALVEFVFVGSGEAVAVDVQRDTITLQAARLRALLEALDADACEDTDADAGADDIAEDGDGSDDSEPCPEPTAPTADATPVESETGDGG